MQALEANGTLSSALLRIEPSGGGGDLQVHASETRIVEQWKSKPGGGTWSLRSVIDDVLPDLYRAVPDGYFDSREEYRFVTEGRPGSWDEAEKFSKVWATQFRQRNHYGR